MRRNPRALTAGTFDMLIIGGGILGAGVARDAALRGLRVALIDRADFASGTSSRSSKLIHGGLRYLEQLNLRLVTESLRERAILRAIASHLVQPCEFLFLVYAHDPRPLWKIRLGLCLYDLIAHSSHRILTSQQIHELEPALHQRDLRGAVAYSDCRTDDARFCLETILHAADLGAVCTNYCELIGFDKQGDHIEAAHVRDTITGDIFDVRACHFVNATGPWLERFANADILSPTKGIHLVLPALTHNRAITFQARQDGRILFVIPWGDCSLVGTTDTDWTGDPAAACATPADVDYLLTEVRRLFPDSGTIITTFAGIRPLLRSTSGPSARSREHRILQHGANLLSIAGGKYTTFRLIAEQVVNRLTKTPCVTATTPMPVRKAPDIASACNYEMAMTVSDYMRRRTHLALGPHGGAETAEKVSREMAIHLGWSDEQRRASLAEYLAEWERNQP